MAAARALLSSLRELVSPCASHNVSFRPAVGALISTTLSISGIPADRLLEELLREYSHLEADKDAQLVSVFVGAAFRLLEEEGTTSLQLERLISTVCLPALSSRGHIPTGAQAEITASLSELISARCEWGLAQRSILAACKAALLEKRSGQSGLYLNGQSSTEAGAADQDDVSTSLTSAVSSHLVAVLVDRAIQILQQLDSSQSREGSNATSTSETLGEGEASPLCFVKQALSEILPIALEMLTDGESSARRRLAIGTLLPALLDAACLSRDAEREMESVNERLWKSCEELLKRDRAQKVDGLAAIACFKKYLLPNSDKESKGSLLDLREGPAFWEAVKSSLLDEDGLVRRQALQVLRLALPSSGSSATLSETGPPEDWVERGADGPPSTSTQSQKSNSDKKKENASRSKNEARKEYHQSRKRELYAAKEMASMVETKSSNEGQEENRKQWDAFLLLYENLDDYTLHLFEATWHSQMEVLLPGDHTPHVSPSKSPLLDFSWVSILWQRGFQHRNPQVRQAVLTSFFDCQSDNDTWTTQITEHFVLGPLWKALDDPVQHVAFGQKGVWSSEASVRSTSFFGTFVSALPVDRKLPFFCAFIRTSLACVPSRPGLLTLASCLEAALAVPKSVVSLSGPKDPLEVPSRAPSSNGVQQGLDEVDDMLSRLRALVEETRRFHNPAYRQAVCEKALRAASGVAKPPHLKVTSLARLLAAFPETLLRPQRALREILVAWVDPSQKPPDSESVHFSSWLTPGLANFLEAYFRSSSEAKASRNGALSDLDELQSRGSSVGGTGTVGETRGWEDEAQQLATFLALELLSSRDVASLLETVKERALEVYRRPYLPAGQAEKTFLLLRALVASCHPDTSPRGSSADVAVARHLSALLGTCMDELTAYASKTSAVLWEGAGMLAGMPGKQTPRSGVGPLGRGTFVLGGGHRALTGEAAATVNRAVLSVSCISECCIWLQKLASLPLPESATNFLLSFLWHFVAFMKDHTDMPATLADADLWAAMIEALSAVCQAAASVSATEVRNKGKESVILVTEEHYEQPVAGFRRALAVVAEDVADDVSRAAAGVLDFASLPRGMRVAVAEHKWLCLSALLSTCAQQPTPQTLQSSKPSSPPKTPKPFLSPEQLLDVLDDISDGLESAGESYISHMLRTLRFLIEMGVIALAADRKGLSESEVLRPLFESAWAATADLSKRRVSVTSSVLATCLHPELFVRPEMHFEDGPIRWLLSKMLLLGQKSPRTIRLAAMQVCELWLRYPRIALSYVSETVQMALHGSDAVEDELDEMLTGGSDKAGEYADLLQSRDPELTEVFTNSEMYVRVSVAVMLHEMVRLSRKSDTSEEEASDYCKFGQAVLMHLLTLTVEDPSVSKNLYKKGSLVHRKKVRAWQLLCVLSPFLEGADVADIRPLTERAIQVQNMSSVRQYVEQFAVQVYLKFPHLVESHLVPWLADVNGRTQTQASLVMIAAHVTLHSAPASVQQEMLRLLFPATLPYLTSHHHNLRTFTQVLVHRLLARFGRELLGAGNENRYLAAIASYLEENVDCQRVRASVDRAWDAFDPKVATTPRGIFCPPVESLDHSEAEKMGSGQPPDHSQRRAEELPFECVPLALYDRVSFFIKEQRDTLRAGTNAQMNALEVEIAGRNDHVAQSNGASVSTRVEDSLDTNANRDFQRKNKGDPGALLPPETDADEDLLLAFAEARARALLDLRGNRQDLIVVATLVARVPNLAGLARTCEVFKAAALVVADKSVADDRQFQLISVSADKWVPLLEVPETGLAAYLQRKKREGYSLVGLEQTANSVPLHTHNFDRKTALVLGREKEGIPAELIHHLDACVEIPQLGVIRSLNVHVSGALAMWEYSRTQFQ